MFWDKEYEGKQRVWGDAPSELAVIAVDYILQTVGGRQRLNILDIGCGYGRDTLYLRKHLDCSI